MHRVSVSVLDRTPIAIFECKRVGVEDGMKKGPQSIEKAKQGAYVAKSISALQKVIDQDGIVYGFLPSIGEKPVIKAYSDIMQEIVTGKIRPPKGFVLTVGVTSNHGNWFTNENQNKEMKVLSSAYDWLLFLTDEGLLAFVNDCLTAPTPEYAAIKKAFMASYGAETRNRFTKTRLDLTSDRALRRYFRVNAARSDKWFNIISPAGQKLPALSTELRSLLRIAE